MLGACSGPKDNRVTEQAQTTIKSVKKNESVNLPVNIFKDSNYKIIMDTFIFTRSITNVEMKDFDESSELDFRDRYNSYVSNKNINLKNDFKLLIIRMKHEINEKAKSSPLEGFVLNKGSGLVIGDKELASGNQFLEYQQNFITTDYMVGRTIKESGNIVLAIPNEYAKNKSLQLKLVQKIDGKNQLVYIDLN
ncbi:hypothetical protein FC701_17030 [Bacillus mycoides]|uniref:Uncharacterized protein n=1 Tax=Bacillus mycoides TaxID=1405 RepID=A0A4U3A8G0_BACMY|nr:hypothetical protein FC701_17030 [Bacillus mycoides]